MNGIRLLLDTNAVIYLLQGNKNVTDLVNNASIYVSAITVTELLSKQLKTTEEKLINLLIEDVYVVHTNDFIVREGASLRRKEKIKTPDALVAATALFVEAPLVSADKIFKKVEGLSFIELTI